MPTLNQLCKNKCRKKKQFKKQSRFLNKNPQRKGVCLKAYTKTPKKPNSALRKVARVKLSNGKKLDVYIPGEGHNLQEYSVVLLQGGGVADLPGVNYRLIRGKYDLKGVKNRKNARSRYGAKKNSI